MDNNKLHITIELDLDAETMLKNNVTLEKIMNWVEIQRDAVVNGFAVSVDAPACCAGDERFHLPGGFVGIRRAVPSDAGSIPPGLSRETFEVVQQGNPFNFVKDEEGVAHLVDALIQNTNQHCTAHSINTIDEGADNMYWHKVLEKTEVELLRACCYFLWCECDEADHNLCSVMKLLNTGVESSQHEEQEPLSEFCTMNFLFQAVAERDPDHIAVSAFDAFKTGAGIQTAREALCSCIHRLKSMPLSSLYKITCEMKSA